MPDNTYDVIIIGAGPGGYTAAARAGAHGKKVLLIEKADIGGLCLNAGCIPSKTLLASAKLFAQMQQGAAYGVHADNMRLNLAEVMARKNRIVSQLRDGILYLMNRHSITVIAGEAAFIDRRTIQVNDTIYRAQNIIIATGSTHIRPNIPGVDLPHVLNTTQAFELDHVPEKIVILGGDAIALGFVTGFSLTGAQVFIVCEEPEILPAHDPELAQLLRKEMPEVTFYTSTRVHSIEPDSIVCNREGQSFTLPADNVLISLGRQPNIAIPGLENIDLDYSPAGIRVNERMQTNLPGIYAIGDVTGLSMWAHSAARMGQVAANNICGEYDRMRYDAIPLPVYAHPEIASVGLTEDQARERGHSVKIARMPMNANGRYLIEGNGKRGMCKIVLDAETNVLLGVHLIGAGCAEMIFGVAAMIEAEFRVQDVQQLVFPHPTISEILKDTLYELH